MLLGTFYFGLTKRRRTMLEWHLVHDFYVTGHLRHAGRLLVQPTGRLGRREGQEHLRQDGREQRRPAHPGWVPQGLPAGRGAVEDARALIRVSAGKHTHGTVRRGSSPRSHLQRQFWTWPRGATSHTKYPPRTSGFAVEEPNKKKQHRRNRS